MLTPEEMARIEEEESRRHAEEQYRAQVRTRLAEAGSAKPLSPKTNSGARSFLKILVFVAACVGTVVLITNVNSKNPRETSAASGSPFTPSVRYEAKTDVIASGQIVVRHGGYVPYRIIITPEMRNPSVAGTFTASGGSGNDVAAILSDEMNFANWINGHQANGFWGTQGQETTGTFDVRLRPGTYYLAFSNRFSALSDKYVFVNVSLNYQKIQTY